MEENDRDGAAESPIKNENQKKQEQQQLKKKNRKKRSKPWVFIVKIILLTFFLSLIFSFIAEITIVPSHIAIAIIIVIIIIIIAIVSDIIGTAAASASIEPFLAMSSRKIHGASKAVWLVKHNEKVSSVCNDVIGDICGIVSGAAGAAISIKIFIQANSVWSVLGGILVSAIIASLTVGGKALGKKLAIANNQKIIFFVAKALSIFSRKKK